MLGKDLGKSVCCGVECGQRLELGTDLPRDCICGETIEGQGSGRKAIGVLALCDLPEKVNFPGLVPNFPAQMNGMFLPALY